MRCALRGSGDSCTTATTSTNTTTTTTTDDDDLPLMCSLRQR